MKNEEREMRNGQALATAVFFLRSPFSVVRSSFFILACVGVQTATGEDAPPKLVGNSSCATAACHGGLAGHKFVGAEFPIWSARDPHSQAYSVLRNDVSQQMAELLKLERPAHESAVCLNCHSPATSTDSKRSSISGRTPIAGVDCEQCHGPAEHWLTEHVRTDWKTRPRDDKRKRGFRDLTDLVERANLCADCHVGGPGRDVNHDLIAAGHPRLFFELATFHANWPKHWPTETDTERHPVKVEIKTIHPDSLFEPRLWAVGQAVTAQRSLELLSLRAANAEKAPATWPEFAEWNCFACHHDLQSASWWQSRDDAKRPRVSFAWNSWPYALLDPLSRQTNGPDVVSDDSPFGKLRSQFSKPSPSAELVKREATAAAESLGKWAENLKRLDAGERLGGSTFDALSRSLAGDDGQRLVARDWDSATQLFLALNGLQLEARSKSLLIWPPNVHIRKQQAALLLNSMNDHLNFSPGLHSPRDFSTPHVEELQDKLRRLQTILSPSDE